MKSIHLRPRSNNSQRIWRIGQTDIEAHAANPPDLCLNVLPDVHESFASFRSILAQLASYAKPEQRSELDKLDAYLKQVSPASATDGQPSVSQFLATSVTFAIMRRISRESVYTARTIDLGARVMNTLLSQIPGCKRVHVPHIDRLDRPSLKVLARAMLLLEPEHGFSWVWHSTSDPTAPPQHVSHDVYLSSRSQLLWQLVNMLSPVLEKGAGITALAKPDAQSCPVSPYDLSVALVIQNYDACFLWGDSLLKSAVTTEVAESLRLMALAFISIGKVDESLRALRQAEELTALPGRRAHLCYLQGLIDAKRLYDLSSSTAHYERGLAALDGAESPQEDLSLERAWLFNGLALNDAILWRRDTTLSGLHERAFAREREAFDLVSDRDDPSRAYLRFNLLANSAFLLEMKGKYQLAVDIFHKAFDIDLDESPSLRERWLSTIGYRIGVLHCRAGQLDEAERLVRSASEQDEATENWFTYERILRALGSIALERKSFTEAADIFKNGLEICRRARSVEGTEEHARGLISALVQTGRAKQARGFYECLESEEHLSLLSKQETVSKQLKTLRPSPPSPKLPAYIPEIDLEGIPTIDLNRFLGKAMPLNAAQQTIVWRE